MRIKKLIQQIVSKVNNGADEIFNHYFVHLRNQYSGYCIYQKYLDYVKCCAGSGPEVGIALDDISEIRLGHGTDTFNNVTKKIGKDSLTNVDVGSGKKLDISRQHCFSICFKGHTRPLDLVADDINNVGLWVSS